MMDSKTAYDINGEDFEIEMTRREIYDFVMKRYEASRNDSGLPVHEAFREIRERCQINREQAV